MLNYIYSPYPFAHNHIPIVDVSGSSCVNIAPKGRDNGVAGDGEGRGRVGGDTRAEREDTVRAHLYEMCIE